MGITDLDHVNMRTAQLEAMTRFYQEVLGLEVGRRPPFSFNGTWLYCGDKAAVHLVEIDSPRPAGPATGIEHFAFAAEGLAGFVERLRAADLDYDLRIVPDFGTRQLHLRDPDGNHVEIAFDASEDVEAAS